MQPVSRRRRAGFTLLETLVVLVIIGIGLKVGLNSMGTWSRAAKIEGASEFYLEGFRLARAEAVKHKSASRISLINNANTNQFDWQVDICFSTVTVVCDNDSGTWSTTTTIATGDPEGATNGFKSVLRQSPEMPRSEIMDQVQLPAGATQVYYTPLGWVDTTVPLRLTRLTLKPPTGSPFIYPDAAIAITLSGMATKCAPAAADHDSRKCPP